MTPARGERGFALIMVLWAVALLALIGAHVTQAGRGETQLVANLRDAAIAEAAADGAVHAAVFHLLDRNGQTWAADGQPRLLSDGSPRLAVRVTDPRGLLNPNHAPPPLMAALIRAVGGDDATADAIAAAIFDWHTQGQIVSPGGAKRAQYEAAGRGLAPSGRAFADLDELGLVLGMTPQLLAALRPHLSLVNFSRIEPQLADPAVAQALTASGVGQPGDDNARPVVLVRAEATLARGTRFVRRAAVQLDPTDASHPARFLTWRSGDD
jgi:general secretion pathway protein K